MSRPYDVEVFERGSTHDAVLRRGPIARLRTRTVVERGAWLAVLAVALMTSARLESGSWALHPMIVLLVVVLAASGLIVRIAVASEYVIADGDGVRWRTMFRTTRVGWDDVVVVNSEIDRSRWQRYGPTLLVLHTQGGRRALRASAGCRRSAIDAWIAAAGACWAVSRPTRAGGRYFTIATMSAGEPGARRLGEWGAVGRYDDLEDATWHARVRAAERGDALVDVVEVWGQVGWAVRSVSDLGVAELVPDPSG